MDFAKKILIPLLDPANASPYLKLAAALLPTDGKILALKVVRIPEETRVKPSKNLTLAGFVASLQNLTEVVSHLSFHVLLLAL